MQMRVRERGVCGMDKNRGCEVCRKKRYPMAGKKIIYDQKMIKCITVDRLDSIMLA